MMELLVTEVVERFYTFVWPMLRISAFFLIAPFFSLQVVTVRIRVLLAVLLTWMIYPFVEVPVIDPSSVNGLVEVFNQVLVGAIMGLILQVVTAALVVGGQTISMSMGLGMANMIDPNVGNVPLLSVFILIFSTLIFLFSFFALPIFSVAAAYANDFSDDTFFIDLAASLIFIYGISAILSPLLVSTLFEIFGSGILFVYIGLIHLSLCIFGFYRMTIRPSSDTKQPYLIIPRTSFVFLKMFSKKSAEKNKDL